jgi:hypothetical protein
MSRCSPVVRCFGARRSNRELFDLLERSKWVASALGRHDATDGRLPEHSRPSVRGRRRPDRRRDRRDVAGYSRLETAEPMVDSWMNSCCGRELPARAVQSASLASARACAS